MIKAAIVGCGRNSFRYLKALREGDRKLQLFFKMI